MSRRVLAERWLVLLEPNDSAELKLTLDLSGEPVGVAHAIGWWRAVAPRPPSRQRTFQRPSSVFWIVTLPANRAAQSLAVVATVPGSWADRNAAGRSRRVLVGGQCGRGERTR